MRSKAIQVNRVGAKHSLYLLGCKREFTLLQPKTNPSKSFGFHFVVGKMKPAIFWECRLMEGHRSSKSICVGSSPTIPVLTTKNPKKLICPRSGQISFFGFYLNKEVKYPTALRCE